MIENSPSRLQEDASKIETVYGDGSSVCDGASVDSGESSPLHGGGGGGQTVISEKVRSLANNVYREFETLIDTYGRDVVHNLMPLVVQCLENLDHLYSEKSDLEIEMDLLREDNNQLINQFEKERQMRKVTEEKILQVEDRHEEYKNDMATKMENLEMNIKMLEVKSKSAQDHVARLEDKEAEMKRENTRLHERYNDLLRNHMEAVERGKAASVIDPDSASVGSAPANRIHIHHHHHPRPHAEHRMSDKSKDLNYTKTYQDAAYQDVNEGSDIEDELGESMDQVFTDSGLLDGESNGNWEQSREELDGLEQDGTMFEEMTMPEEGDVQSDEGPDCLDDQDYESEFGMSREIDNLIKENMDLVETKNALNIVKDDLITQLDDMTCENEMLRDEVLCLTDVKSRLKTRVRTLESELKEVKGKLEKAMEKIEEMGDDDDENGDSDSKLSQTHRRRFTRSEMVRLLSERNQYKERLMELEDAVRWTEMMRAKRDHPELVTDTGAGSTSGKRGMWKYFSGLFGTTTSEDQSVTQSVSASPSTTGLNVFNANATNATPSSTSDTSKSTDSTKPRKSGARGSLSAASNAIAAFASFLAPSPSSAAVSNPLFMTAPPSNNLALSDTTAPSRSSLTESQSNPALSSAAMPKLVTHDIRLLPAPRGPGSAVKRLEESNSEQR